VKKNLIYLLLLISGISNAKMSGDGTVELGLSVEKQRTTTGLAGSYYLSSVGSHLSTLINSDFQIGSNLGVGRTDELVTESNYQYEESQLGLDGVIDYKFDQRGFNWHNAFDTEIAFQQENGEINWDTSDAEKSWTVTSGPSLLVGNKSRVAIMAEILMSSQSALDVEVSEENYNLALSKALTSRTLIGVSGRNVCTHFQNQELQEFQEKPDSCRQEYNVNIQKINKHSDFLFEFGITKLGSRDIEVHSADFSYEVNSNARLTLLSTRSLDTLVDQENIILESISSVSPGVINTRAINYSLDQGRARMDLGFLDQEVESELVLTNSSVATANFAFPLDSELCALCTFNVGYEYSNNNEERIQKITTISLLKNISKRVSTALKLSQSVVEDEFEVWSMNLTISYNGLRESGG
jgi:hypothetical protein